MPKKKKEKINLLHFGVFLLLFRIKQRERERERERQKERKKERKKEITRVVCEPNFTVRFLLLKL